MKTSGGLAAAACAAFGVSLATGAQAQEFEFGLRAGGNYSDNVERVPTGETSSASGIVGVDFNGQRDTGRLLYDVFGNLEYQHFFEDDVDAETFGQAYATTSYAIVPERFIWGLSGSFDQTRSNLLRPVAPENLDDVITLSTGPQWTMRFGNSLESTLEGHYIVADYSERPFDSDTAGGSLVFGRRQGATRFIGFGGSFDQVDYDDDTLASQDFERREVFVRVNAQGARTTLDVDAGYSEVEGDTFDDDGPMFRVSATRELTGALSAFLNFNQLFPTSGGATFSPGAPPQLGTDSSVLTGGPRKVQNIGAGLQMRARRTDASLSFVMREEEDLETSVQRDFDVITASGTYSFAPRASFTLYARFSDEDVVGVESDEEIYGGRLNFQIGRLTSLSLRLENRSRDSDVPEGEYEENLAGLFLRYGGSTGAEGWR
jgi:hypothetical protein